MLHTLGQLTKKLLLISVITLFISFNSEAHLHETSPSPASIDYSVHLVVVAEDLHIVDSRGTLLGIVRRWVEFPEEKQTQLLNSFNMIKNVCNAKAAFAHISAMEVHVYSQHEMLAGLKDRYEFGGLRNVPHFQYVDLQRIIRDAVRKTPDPVEFGFENLKYCINRGF